MLLYEHDRTKDIVNRLVMASRLVGFVIVLYLVVVMAILFIIMANLAYPDFWLFSGILGAIIGLILGLLVAWIMTIVLEWMSQMLVAQGEILSQLRKKNKA
jgi:tetrahydromethanopterin S-methyltransferase subunit F